MSEHDVYVGVDPGALGYICILTPTCGVATFIKNKESPKILYQNLVALKIQQPIMPIMIESVHSLFGMSAKSNFNFGFNLGEITTICSLVTEIQTVTPKVWQKAVGVTVQGKEIKKFVGGLCAEMYPDISVHGPKGGLLDGKSDSLMIAHYNFLINH